MPSRRREPSPFRSSLVLAEFPPRLSRATRHAGPAAARTSGAELHGIQVLRAFAALSVVTHHALEQSNGAQGRFSADWLTTAGASGVDVFFVISGFIMLHVSFRPGRRPLPAAGFLIKRATRIYPLYWLCCLAMLLVSTAGYLRHHEWNGSDILPSFLLLPLRNQLIGVSWTLVYEVYFYLVFATALLLGSMRVSVVGSTAAIIGLALAGGVMPVGTLQSFLANPIALEFCMGLWLAWAFARWPARGCWPIGWPSGLAGIVLLATAPIFTAHPDTTGLDGLPRVLAWGLPATLVVAACLRAGPPRTSLTRFAVLLGEASYALYLTHVFVIVGYGKLLKVGAIGCVDQVFLVPVVVAVAVVLGLSAHLVVERPLLAVVRNVTRRDGPVCRTVRTCPDHTASRHRHRG